ncbi:MAG TPA: zf-HC2 domain-containing protein [Candidatus Hydrogenedentes bacterium]|nr:zf-HC2 domain-containing protein [Candidatus Hydrogenedentota bacterium]
MPTCEKIREEFSALLDGELDAETREAVEAHLHECSECLLELGRYKKVSEMYGRLERVPAPPDFEERVADAIWPKIVPLPERKKFHLRWMSAFAAAAVLLIIAGTFVVLPKVHAPGKFKISKLKEAPAAETAPRPEPPEAAPKENLYSAEKGASDLADESAASSLSFYSKMDAAKQTEESPVNVFAPPPAPMPVAPQKAAPVHELVVPKPESLPELKSEPETEPKPESMPTPTPEAAESAALPVMAKKEDRVAREAVVGEAASKPVTMNSDASDIEEEARQEEPPPPPAMPAAAPSAPPVAAASPAPAASSAPTQEGRGRRSEARGTFGAGYGGSSVMKEQKVSHVPTQTNERVLSGKTFVYLEDTWFERGYSGQDKVSVDRGSSQYQDLLKKYPDIAQWSDLGSRVVVKLDDAWYLIVAGTKQP